MYYIHQPGAFEMSETNSLSVLVKICFAATIRCTSNLPACTIILDANRRPVELFNYRD